MKEKTPIGAGKDLWASRKRAIRLQPAGEAGMSEREIWPPEIVRMKSQTWLWIAIPAVVVSFGLLLVASAGVGFLIYLQTRPNPE